MAKRQRAIKLGLPLTPRQPRQPRPLMEPADLAPDQIDAIAAAALVHIRYQRRMENDTRVVSLS